VRWPNVFAPLLLLRILVTTTFLPQGNFVYLITKLERVPANHHYDQNISEKRYLKNVQKHL
jgi:hypothetical protein